ncbi:MAG: adenylate/guanylate cyclase domain-containing protein [Bdellovibrionota bacterium]
MRWTFRRKLYAAISLLVVGSTAGSLLFFYLETKGLLLEQMGDRLEDVGRTAIHYFTPEERESIKKLKTQLDTEIRAAGLVLAPINAGEYKEVLHADVAKRIMSGPDFQRLVSVLRKIKLSTRKRLHDGSSSYATATAADEPSIAYATILTTIPASPNREVLQFLADADYDKADAPNPVGNLFHNNSTALQAAFDGEVTSDKDYREEESEVLLSAGIPILNEDGSVLAILALDYDAKGEANQVRRLAHVCLVIVLGSLLLSLSVASVLAALFGRPIHRLREGADRVALRDYETQIDLKSTDELGMLAAAFNSMVREIASYAAGLEALNSAYARFVPQAFLEQLGQSNIVDVKLGQQVQKQMTVLFSDIRSFTSISESMSPRDNFDFINQYLGVVSPVIRKYGGFIDKYIGDGIMALFPNSGEMAIRAAVEMQRALKVFNEQGKDSGRPPIRVGIGLHSGNLMLGTVGEEQRMDGTVISDAVNLAARLEGITKDYGARIIVSERVLDSLSKDDLFYTRYLGQATVKGKQNATRIFEVIDGDDDDSARRKIITKVYFERGVRSFEREDYLKANRLFRRVVRLHKHDLAAQMYLTKCIEHGKAKLQASREEERKKLVSVSSEPGKIAK